MTSCITVTISAVRGSAPREAGTAMQIWPDRQTGTIGGGALEWQATQTARDMLRQGIQTQNQTIPLGPSLGQCCGGSVTLRFEQHAKDHPQAGHPVWIWGAGHVGRAIVTAMAPLPDFAITWADTAPNRFPADLPDAVSPLVAADLPRALKHAPPEAFHLILTYSHDIDLALCDAILRHGSSFVGLIGSSTKWARFQSRLAQFGHTPDEIARITCPIGDPSLGKHPAAIALGVASQLLKHPAQKGAPE